MRTTKLNTATAASPDSGAELLALTRQRLAELDRLRDFGFIQLGRLNEATLALPQDQLLARMIGPKGHMAEYDRFTRSIRQIMVLEFELRGLFKAPDRDASRKLRLVKSDRPGFQPPKFEDLMADLANIGNFDLRGLDPLDIRTDYRRGPLDEVVAGIRETLGAEPPLNDPFAPAARKAPDTLTPAPVAVPPKPPEFFMRSKPAQAEPVSVQEKPAMKAASLVIKATGGNGFRMPSAKSRPSKRRRNRGPPK